MHVFVTGINFRTASIDILEKVFVHEDELSNTATKLIDSMNLREVVVLSTCNRVEIYGVSDNSSESIPSVVNYFHQNSGFPVKFLDGLTYTLQEGSAVEHLFKVTSSVDSMIVGEPQITGQVKRAYEMAKSSNTTGKIFNFLFPKAFSVAKKVRTNTELSKGPVSIASVSVRLAKKIFSDVSDRSALLIGAGEMGERAAFHFKKYHFSTLYIYNRSRNRAASLAKKYGGIVVSNITQALAQADIIIASTSSSEFILTRDQILQVMKIRRNHPLFIIDIAIPRNVDPEVGMIENVYLFNIDDLGKIVVGQKMRRENQVKDAEVIIREEVETFNSWCDRLSLESTIAELKEKVEKMFADEISKNIRRLTASDSGDEVAKQMSRSLTRKVLHDPITVLKGADEKERNRFIEATCRLFRLENNE
jgi:glutamyl-tRNA reductase